MRIREDKIQMTFFFMHNMKYIKTKTVPTIIKLYIIFFICINIYSLLNFQKENYNEMNLSSRKSVYECFFCFVDDFYI